MLVYSKYARTLTRDEQDALWRDYRVVGRLFGLRERDMPRDIEAFEAYMAERYASPELVVTPQARELAIDIVLRPPVPLHLRPCSSSSTRSRSACCRRAVREQYGFSWDPLRAVALHGGAEYVKRVRRARAARARADAADRARRLGGIARQLAVDAAPDPERVVVAAAPAGAAPRGAFWKATGRSQRRIAVMPTDVCAGALVAGNGPPWCMP